MASSIVIQRIMLLLTFSSLIFHSVNCELTHHYNIDNIPSRVITVLRELKPENIIKTFMSNNVNRAIQSETEEDIKCDAQAALLITGLQQFELWALQMIDSSSKIPAGILKGNLKDLGVYDECISAKIEKGNETIRGHHCMYSLSSKELNLIIPYFSPRLSICLPAACSPQRVSMILQNAIDMLSDYIGFFGIDNVQCSSGTYAPFHTGEIVTIVILSLFLCVLAGCTLVDIISRILSIYPEPKLKEFYGFSFYANLLRIFDTTVPNGTIRIIHGIRVLSLFWIILGHQCLMTMTGATINFIDEIMWTISWNALYILLAPFAVDTFFVLSGFLTSYLFMQEMSKGRTFNPIMYYLHRYIRLTPVLAAMILSTIYIVPRSGSGALWESTVNTEKRRCEANWWPMMLYIQNFLMIEPNGCLSHTWYLAVDMQLYWISPLILYPLSKKPKIGLIILSVFGIASIVIPAVLAGVNGYSGALITRRSDYTSVLQMTENFYTRPYTRAGPWLIGIFLGYEVTSKRRGTTFKRMTTGWIVASLSFAFVFFTYRIFQSVDYDRYAPWEIFYAGLSRHIWALGVSWLIYASVYDCGGIITKFLSHPVFIPFSRISYCVYLVHKVIQSMITGASRVPIYFHGLGIIHNFFGSLIFSCVAGLVLSLVFESPFLALEKIVFKRNKTEFISRESIRKTLRKLEADNDAYSLRKKNTGI